MRFIIPENGYAATGMEGSEGLLGGPVVSTTLRKSVEVLAEVQRFVSTLR
jgi:hypothetical protein